MKTFTYLLILSIASILMASTCEPTIDTPTTVNINSLSRAEIDEIVEEEMALQNIVGICVGVVENGVVTETRAYGHRNQERTLAVSTSTLFRWASVSKPLTAVAIFKAITSGDLGLNDKATDHTSLWSSNGTKDDITVAQLLSHRSGINHYGVNEEDKFVCVPVPVLTTTSTNWNAQASLNRFKHCALLFTPGTEHRYSSYAYDLLGAVLEGATNRDYVSYVNEHVKDVADLSSLTGFASSPGGYNLTCNLKRSSKNEGNTTLKIPSGGWSSDIRDMARFMQGIVNNEFLATSYFLWQDVSFTDNDNYHYGFKKENKNGSSYVNHGGAHDDVRTFMGFFPGDKNGVVVMMNTGSSGSASRVGEKLLDEMGYNFSSSTLPRNENGDKLNCGETMVSVWRDTEDADETVIRRGLNHDDFLAERNHLRDLGWILIDMETYLDGAIRKWDGIFKKGETSTSIWRNFTTESWFEKWEEENEAGRRLIDIESYKSGSNTRWAGLFQSGNSGNYAMYRNYNTDDFGDLYFEKEEQGKKLIDIETYTVGTTRKWAGVWLGTGDSPLNRGYQQDAFIDLCRERVDDGYRLVDVETYVDGSVRKFAGVWERDDEPEARWFNINMGDWVNEKHNDLITDGYELLDLEKY